MAVSIVRNPSAYVVETGTNNSWRYRKWSDGTYEAWRTYSGTVNLTSQSAGTYYGSNITIPLPSFSTGSINAQATARAPLASGLFVYKYEAYTNSSALEFRAHVSVSNGNCGANLYVVGTY